MCNLYGHQVSRAEYLAHFRAKDQWRRDLEKTYTAPGGLGWTVRNVGGDREMTAMQWGFPLPGKKPVVNVRNYESPFWRSALVNPDRRCLVPVTRFQEWSVDPDPATGKKRPYWFHLQASPIFAFAGIWRPTETEPVFAFLTCGYDGDPSTHIVGAIHPKACPVILHPEDYDRWLSADVDDALQLATAFPSQLMAIDGPK